MFVTVQRENIRPSEKDINKAVTKSKLPDVCSLAMNHYVSLSLTNRESSVHLKALYSPRTAQRTFTPPEDQLVICGLYELQASKVQSTQLPTPYSSLPRGANSRSAGQNARPFAEPPEQLTVAQLVNKCNEPKIH
jgi:hypothetical protein